MNKNAKRQRAPEGSRRLATDVLGRVVGEGLRRWHVGCRCPEATEQA